MYAILNNDIDYKIPVTEVTYDYLLDTFHLKDHVITEWSQELINHLTSMKDIDISSITIKNKYDETLYTYSNLIHKIINFGDIFQYFPSGRTFTLKALDIAKID